MRPLITCVSFLLFTGIASAATGQSSPRFHFGAYAGGAIDPSICGSGGCSLGFQGGAYGEYELESPFALRLDGSFGRTNGDPVDRHLSEARRDVVAGLLEGVVGARAGLVRPYLLAGAGVARVSATSEGYNPHQGVFRDDEGQTVFAWRIGGGIVWQIAARSGLILEVRYSKLATTGREVIAESLGFVEFVAGIRF